MCCLCEEHFETSQFTDLTLERLISDAVPTLFQAEKLFCRRINRRSSTRIKVSPEMQPCSSGSFQNLHRKEKCVQRLMPLFPYLKVYEHRFLHNLPRNLTIRKSNHAGAHYGIWSIEDIPFGTRYGPFDTIVSPPNPKNKLRVQYFHKTGQQNNVEKPVSGRMALSINWLQYVNLASNAEQQNLLIYQCQGKIYYLCYKPIPANTELLVWYGPYIEEKKDCYSIEEVDKSVHWPPFCNEHRISAFYLSEMEISLCMNNLAAILGVGKKTENELVKLALKELNNVERISMELRSEKANQYARFNVLKKHLLSLMSPVGHHYNGNIILDEVKIPSIRRPTPREEEISSIEHLAIVLGVEGRTGKEILDLTSLELILLREVELKLREEKYKEESKHRELKRRFFLTSGKDLKTSSVEIVKKYCITCEHSYSYNIF